LVPKNNDLIIILVNSAMVLWRSKMFGSAGVACLQGDAAMHRLFQSYALAALIAAALAAPNPARADGGGFAAGLLGGLIGGAIVGSAVAPRPAYPEPVYVEPEPYYQEPLCFGRQQVFDPYYRVYRWQRVRVPCY
jgi:hypothetical protein